MQLNHSYHTILFSACCDRRGRSQHAFTKFLRTSQSSQKNTEERQRAGGRRQEEENIIFALSNQGFKAPKFIYEKKIIYKILHIYNVTYH
ncbi:MAG: hypothetical protein V7L31_09580 [Nostoc sp.]|uniref:hypothetical protein n=1 Tax=Nostoc sp. TaxID=1180 RepID=UPI002FF0476E